MSFEYWLEFFREANIEEDCAPIYANIFVNHRINSENVLLLNDFYLNRLGIECVGHIISILGIIQKKKEKLLHSKAQQENDVKKASACEKDSLNPCVPAIEADHSSEPAYKKLHKAEHTSLTILEKSIKPSQDYNPISSPEIHEPESKENLDSQNLPEQNNNCRDVPVEYISLANKVTSVDQSSWMGYLKHRLKMMQAEIEAEMEANSGPGPSFPLSKKSCLRPGQFIPQRSIMDKSHPRRRQVKFQPKSPDVLAFEVQYKVPHFHKKKDLENYHFPSLLRKNHCLSLMSPEDLKFLARKFSPSRED